jgi:hypothetical protein
VRLIFRPRSLRPKQLKVNAPWRDDTTHLVVPPLEFMRRVELPLWGDQNHWCYISYGSRPCENSVFARSRASSTFQIGPGSTIGIAGGVR